MQSVAFLTVSNETVYVSFQSPRFQAIKNKFVEVFPQAVFQQKPLFLLRCTKFKRHHVAWQLPVAAFDEVEPFCRKHFFKVYIEQVDKPVAPAQLGLSL